MLARLLYLVIFCLGCSARLLAQTYEPGYLVRSTGDTLRGEIENAFWDQPPTFIRFRPAAGGTSQLFQPRQLRAVSFTNGRFFRYEVLLLDQSAETRLAYLPRGSYVTMEPDSVLADVLLTGPVELLRVVLPGAVHYEMRRAGQPPLRLSQRQYLRETDTGSWQVTDGNNYRSQLDMYFIDCPAAGQVAQRVAFTAGGLGAVAQAYARNCAPPTGPPARSWLAQARLRRRTALRGGVLAGGRYNHIGSASGLVEGSCTDCLPHPYGGFYAELLLPGRTTAIYGELSLSSFRSQDAYYVGYDPTTGNTQYQVSGFRAALGTARLGLRHFFPLPHDQQLLLGAGYEYNTVLVQSPASPIKDYGYAFFGNAFAVPTLLPGLELGWRRQRLTANLSGQLYYQHDDTGLGNVLFGSSWAARFGLSYRLGRNTDDAARPQP
ncbi:hypothetical protein [Hymenobacter psoromatis]|uniref:hypothetical protein n=1 Tax=Hymenobacter psoromatis TaxID=1484116 RepID=UPI001CBAA03A|nr:hypothetical protein [Hymenobacter psoromatis]